MVRNRASPACVGSLVAAQEFFAIARRAAIAHIGIAARGVAMPDVDLGAGKRAQLAPPMRETLNASRSGTPGLTAPVRGSERMSGAIERLFHEKRAFGLLRARDA